MSKAIIRKLLLNVHMGLGHEGLSKLCKKELNLDVEKLDSGDLIICMNTRGDKMKWVGAKGLVVHYLRMPKNRPIMRDALALIPASIGNPDVAYEAAVRAAIYKRVPALKGVQ